LGHYFSFCLDNTSTPVCHDFSRAARIFLTLTFVAAAVRAQSPPAAGSTGPAPSAAAPNFSVKIPRPDAPPPYEWKVDADHQSSEGRLYHLRGHASIEGTDVMLTADEIDYDEDTHYVEARGNVVFHQYAHDEELHADKVEYRTKEETGKFYNVRGWSRTHVVARPGVLTTNTPLYFEGQWAERLQDKYILHNGLITNCKLPNPWWTLRAPTFDIYPDDHAIAHRSIFRLRWMPLLYTPYFRKSLEKLPRQSGFLTPTIGHSSIGGGGYMAGLGYYWAINRSYDATYRVLDYTAGAIAHHLDFRGKPTERSDFDVIFYGAQDTGIKFNGTEPSGFSIYAQGKAELGDGFYARGAVDYLSSLNFREAFTQSFNEAVFTETSSVGFIAKEWSSFTFDAVSSRVESFQSTVPGDAIIIRKLPEVELTSRDRQIWDNLPVWVSFDSTAGLYDRSQPEFQTPQFMERVDMAPQVITAFDWKGFHIVPGFSLRETNYGAMEDSAGVVAHNLNRLSRDFDFDLIFPSFARVYRRKTFLGDKLKHVIEPRVSYRYVSGVQNFNEVIRFDSADLVSNTNQLELSLTNRVYAKRGNDVWEVFTWQLWQQRYFDPSFGGAVIAGERNVVLSSVELTPYAFLNGPRNYSPVVSAIAVSPKPGWRFEWRADYDPLVKKIVDSGFSSDFRKGNFFISAGHNVVACRPLTPADEPQCQLSSPNTLRLLAPQANQIRGRIGWGDPNHRGWNVAFDTIYDYRLGIMQYGTAQVTYNTDCCGLSAQYRRLDFGIRNETQFLVSFSVANFGSFGTLRKQERLF
jgi:LPS-assembly protein